MAVELICQDRDVLGAPTPFAHIGAVALDKPIQSLIERARNRCMTVWIRALYPVAPLRMILDQESESRGGEGTLLGQRQTRPFVDEDEPHLVHPGVEDQWFGPILVHHAVPFGEKRERLPGAVARRRREGDDGQQVLGGER